MNSNREPSDDNSPPAESAGQATERARDQGATDFMGPGFSDEVHKVGSKRRAFEFWYHPYTELFVFVLVLLSVILLIIEVVMPTGEPVGWMGGLSAGIVTGWFFWADIAITAVLALEYASKLWITPAGRKWFFVRNTWIELLSLLPVLRVFRLFRIFRTMRIFRLMRILRTVRLMRTGTMMTRMFQGYGSDITENRAGNVIIATYFVSAMLFGTLGILIFEKGAGSGLDTLPDALWWCVVTLSTVGYGDTVPQTAGGRIVASVVMVLGLGFWSVMIGVFTTSLVRRARKKETIGLDILGIHDHIIVFGWNENGMRLVRDLHSREPFRHLVVVTENDELGLGLDSRLHHLSADPAEESTLQRAHLDTAETAVILANNCDQTDDVDVDARTLMISLAARSQRSDLRIVVELLDEQNTDHARATGADDIVVTQNYTGALMSQCVQSPGVNRAYQQLFDVGRGARFSELDIPDTCAGRSFAQAAVHLFETQQVSLVGYRRDTQLYVAPDEDSSLRKDDRAIVVEADLQQHPEPTDSAASSAPHSTLSKDIASGDRVIVCGWSREARRMVADLYAVAPELSVTVICDRPPSSASAVPRSSHVEHIQTDPTREATLSKAGVADAHAVVIVADRQHGGTAQTLDARTILTALTVRKLSSTVHLIVELRNEGNRQLAINAGVDESLFADQFSGAMLSQSLHSPGLSRLFTALFETGAGSALDERPIPSNLVGSTFYEALPTLLASGDGAPIGVRRQACLFLPPSADLSLQGGDRIFFLHRID